MVHQYHPPRIQNIIVSLVLVRNVLLIRISIISILRFLGFYDLLCYITYAIKYYVPRQLQRNRFDDTESCCLMFSSGNTFSKRPQTVYIFLWHLGVFMISRYNTQLLIVTLALLNRGVIFRLWIEREAYSSQLIILLRFIKVISKQILYKKQCCLLKRFWTHDLLSTHKSNSIKWPRPVSSSKSVSPN